MHCAHIKKNNWRARVLQGKDKHIAKSHYFTRLEFGGKGKCEQIQIDILILLGIDGTECSIENLIKYSYWGMVLLFPAVPYAVYNPRKPMQ